MKRKILIIAAALPPALDGIGDYTANLAAELAGTVSVKILTTYGASAAPIPEVAVEEAFSVADPASVRNLLAAVWREKPDCVLLQYNPFSYGRWGLNPHLPRVMRRIKAQMPHVHFALMVHEMFVKAENWRFTLMRLWQVPQFRQLGQCADTIFFSVGPWAEVSQKWFPEKRLLTLPVGSNIPYVPITRAEARGRLGLRDDTTVLGVFGSAHPDRLLSWVREAAEAVSRMGRDVLVLHLGPQAAEVRRIMGPIPLRADGPLPADEISRRFAAMDVHLAPFADGVSTRRTSLMTGLQHGVPTVATRGPATGASLRESDGTTLLLTEVEMPGDFSKAVVQCVNAPSLQEKLSREGRSIYESQFSWPRIAAGLLKALPQ